MATQTRPTEAAADFAQRLADFLARLMRLLADIGRALLGRPTSGQIAEAQALQLTEQRQQQQAQADEVGAERVRQAARRMEALNAADRAATTPPPLPRTRDLLDDVRLYEIESAARTPDGRFVDVDLLVLDQPARIRLSIDADTGEIDPAQPALDPVARLVPPPVRMELVGEFIADVTAAMGPEKRLRLVSPRPR